MKTNFLRTLVLAIATIGIFSIQSCDTDPCKDVACGDNGVCLEGTCICDDGYDGSDCNIVIRSLFLGTYNVEEICDGVPNFTDNYVSKITESSQGTGFINVDNIYNFPTFFPSVQPEDATALASVSVSGDEYVLLIESQTFTSAILADFEVAGSGIYNPSTSEITLTYSITDTSLDPVDAGYIDNCTQIYTPQ